MKNQRHDRRIHVLIFESENQTVIRELMRSISRVLPPKVNILSYQVDDGFFRVVLGESAGGCLPIGSCKKQRRPVTRSPAFRAKRRV